MTAAVQPPDGAEGSVCVGCTLRITRPPGGEWAVAAPRTSADGLTYCPPDPDATPTGTHQPVTDAVGLPVDVPAGVPLDVAMAYFAGRVQAPQCPHYLAQSEWRAGFVTCERCG